MVSLSLDTSELVHLLRSPHRTTQAVLDQAILTGFELIVSPVVRHELVSGTLLSAAPERRLAQLEELLVQFAEPDFSPDDASASGRLRASLLKQGTPIGDIDTLIAGQALARGWTLVTRNVRHFGRVSGLSLIDWSIGPDPLSVEAIAGRVSG
ncbi:tRNA(fMet)-specific endonuclease VapC [Brevundimonas subvibrioides]|uniref:type II toxin-antitoxin system VapC family toxin n=1 Tax=Brevundimonas subvibrioides TaxID=74313 RepID=UPI0032D5B12E